VDAINELGLDDFLAKLKSVTGRAPAAPRQDGADARVGRAFAPEKAEYEYELSRLDEEIAVLKAGGTAAVSRSVPPLAQRSAAPLPLPPAPAARSPRDPARAGLAVFDSVPLVNFDGTLVFSGGAVVDHAGPPSTVPDPYGVGSAADGADDSVQRKIMRMQEALRESRQMRASLAITDPGEKDRSGGYDAGPILERATRNVTRAVRAAPPGDGPPQRHATHTGPGAPLQPSREMNALRELNHGQISPQKSPPPQLLRKKQQVLQQQFPAPISGPDPAEPMSEQELLSMVSRMYEGDHDLQQRLWEMISDGAIRTPRELRAFAEGVRREAYRTQLAQGVSMHAPRARSSGAQHPMLPQPPPGYPAQPPHHQQGWDGAHHPYHASLSHSMDYAGQVQRTGAPPPPPPPPLQHRAARAGGAHPQYSYQQFPAGVPLPQHAMPQEHSKDADILSKSFDAVCKLASSPAYAPAFPQPVLNQPWGPAPPSRSGAVDVQQQYPNPSRQVPAGVYAHAPAQMNIRIGAGQQYMGMNGAGSVGLRTSMGWAANAPTEAVDKVALCQLFCVDLHC
jgi:hypothetical protein